MPLALVIVAVRVVAARRRAVLLRQAVPPKQAAPLRLAALIAQAVGAVASRLLLVAQGQVHPLALCPAAIRILEPTQMVVVVQAVLPPDKQAAAESPILKWAAVEAHKQVAVHRAAQVSTCLRGVTQAQAGALARAAVRTKVLGIRQSRRLARLARLLEGRCRDGEKVLAELGGGVTVRAATKAKVRATVPAVVKG